MMMMNRTSSRLGTPWEERGGEISRRFLQRMHMYDNKPAPLCDLTEVRGVAAKQKPLYIAYVAREARNGIIRIC